MSRAKQQKMPFMLMAENALVLEEVAKEMDRISEAFVRINESRLNRRAVTVLLQDMMGEKNITKKQIGAILDAGSNLSKYFLKNPK